MAQASAFARIGHLPLRPRAKAAPAPAGKLDCGQDESAQRAALAADGIYSRPEEIANWLTHGLGAVLSTAALVVLLVIAVGRGDGWHVASFAVYGLSLAGVYIVSTLYHISPHGRRRQFFRRLDHAAIFMLIAGTYTPLLVTCLRGPWGWSLLAALWTFCGVGAALKLTGRPWHPLASTLTYLLTAWLIVLAVEPLRAALPASTRWHLFAGGFCYTAGVAFYLWHRVRYHHAIWHGFVLGGSACHFVAIMLLLT